MGFERSLELQNIVSPIDVIVGEGNDGHAELVKASLQEIGIVNNLYRGRNGDETLAFVRHACRGRRDAPDVASLIILDCDLPRGGGVAVLRALKSDGRYSWIPVIMMTAAKDRRQAEDCRRLGCDAYATKWAVFLGLPGLVRSVRALAGRATRMASCRRSGGRNHRDGAGTFDRRFIPTAGGNHHRGQELNGKEERDESAAP